MGTHPGSAGLPESLRRLREAHDELRGKMPTVVLLVEDDPSVRMFDGVYLEEEGFAVVVARDGVEALEALTPEIGLIITDVMMPRLDGREWIARARQDGYADVPVLFKSGRPQPGLANEFAGSAFLQKPYFQEDLVEAVQKLLPYQSLPQMLGQAPVGGEFGFSPTLH
jgi:CheY-like chemotaxis protein